MTTIETVFDDNNAGKKSKRAKKLYTAIWRWHFYESNDCLHCFFAMQKRLHDQTEKYQKNYGLVPTFKAGLHYGEVTVGEIGSIKKDLMFSGDVLNTTARIQGLCNIHQVDLLVSGQLIRQLNLEKHFKAENLGETELRGRNEKISIFTVAPNHH